MGIDISWYLVVFITPDRRRRFLLGRCSDWAWYSYEQTTIVEDKMLIGPVGCLVSCSNTITPVQVYL